MWKVAFPSGVSIAHLLCSQQALVLMVEGIAAVMSYESVRGLMFLGG